MKKIMVTASAFLFSVALSTGAMAAGEYGTESSPQATESQMMHPTGTHQTSAILSSKNIIGEHVKDTEGKSLGKIKSLLIDTTTGRVGYAVVSDHPVPWNAIHTNAQQKTFTLNMSEAKFKQAPKGKSIASEDEEKRINEFYGVAPYWEGGAKHPTIKEGTPSEEKMETPSEEQKEKGEWK